MKGHVHAGALQMGAAPPPAQTMAAGPAVQLADSAALLSPDVAASPIHVLPSPSPLPFGDKDPYGDAAASRGGAMPAQYQPHQATPGHSPAPYMPDQAAPAYISRLVVNPPGGAAAPPPTSIQPGTLTAQALNASPSSDAAAPSRGTAALQSAISPPVPPPGQASQENTSSANAASPAEAAAPPPAPPLPVSPPDQASQGSPITSPAPPPSAAGPDSQQAGSVSSGDVPVQPYALPPVTASAQSDQQPLLKVYQDSADHWRKISIAGVQSLPILTTSSASVIDPGAQVESLYA